MAARGHAVATGSRLFQCYADLRRNEGLSAEALSELSNRRLRATLDHAYESIPYYRRVFDERGLTPADIACKDDLHLLPVTTKDDIRAHFDDFHPRSLPPDTKRKMTSGSTGEPFCFLDTQEMHDWHNAAKLRAWAWAGYSLGTPILILWGSTFDLKGYSSLTGRLRRFVNRETLLNSHTLSDAVCARYVEAIRRRGIRGMNAYTNAAYHLARYCLDHGISDVHLDFVFTTAETLFPDMRLAIEEAFGCRVFDHYGSRETSLVSQECPEHGGYHMSTDTGIIEVVRDGQQVARGETGDILVTGFHNRIMPFIRYDMGDVATAATEPCPCGRPFPTFRSLEGRVSDLIRLRDGRTLDPLFIVSIITPDPEHNFGKPHPLRKRMKQYQVVQETYERFTVKLVLNPEASLSDYDYLQGNFARFVTPDAEVHVEQVDEIPAQRSGKRRCIMSLVEPGAR
ncbi:MAG: phenylacetate--CoA ligase family protein [bacterium]|nr:phenylacetate--CoA ligase family protein [bacterium]